MQFTDWAVQSYCPESHVLFVKYMYMHDNFINTIMAETVHHTTKYLQLNLTLSHYTFMYIHCSKYSCGSYRSPYI